MPALSIIVLPLTLEGKTPDAEWLADALHGDLVIAVAQLQNSLVIARDTASTYKGKAVDPRQVAREMGVRHVVQGSLRQEGGRIRLNLTLTDGESGVQRWSEAFDTDRAQLAQAVSDFGVAIERTLVAELYRSTGERIATLSPTEVSADDLAMQGYALWYRGVTRENVLAARALFDRALTINPNSARAWGGVQFTTTAVLSNGWVADRPTAIRRAEEAAANLQRLDRDGNYTYSSKTFLLFMKRDFPGMLRTTTEWSERYRLPLAFGAHGAALLFNGRFDEAVAALERALRLGPRDPFRAVIAGPAGAPPLRCRPLRAGERVESDRSQHHSDSGVAANSRRRAAEARPPRGSPTGVRRARAQPPGIRSPLFGGANSELRNGSRRPNALRLIASLRELGMRD